MNTDFREDNISEEMMQQATYIEDAEFAVPGTIYEIEVARHLRDGIESKTGKHARLEPYKLSDVFGRKAMPYLSIWYFVSMVIFFCSFLPNPNMRYMNIILAILSFLILSIGVTIHSLFLYGFGKFTNVGISKFSYNVVAGDISTPDKKNIILCSNHDAKYGSFLKDYAFSKKLTSIALPIATAIYMLLIIIRAIIAETNPQIVAVFVVLPLISVGFSVYLIISHFSLFKKNIITNNGIGVAVTEKLFEYFSHEGNELKNYNIKFVSFGGETAANSGSKAFFRDQNKSDGDIAINVVDIVSGEYRISFPKTKDKRVGEYFSKFCSYMNEEDKNIVRENAKVIDKILDIDKRYASDIAKKYGCDSVTIYAKKSKILNYQPTLNDIGTLYNLIKNALIKMDEELKVEGKNNSEHEETI